MSCSPCSYTARCALVSLAWLRGAPALADLLRREPRYRRLNDCTVLCAALWLGLALLASPAPAQSIAFDIRPARLEAEITPGTEKTVGFHVQTAGTSSPSRETLVMESTDWTIAEDGSLNYAAPGTLKDSASPWIRFSPAAFALLPNMNQLVRITVTVPPNTPPGSYRTGMFVQERPPATPPPVKGPQVIIRVRYAFFLYVIVPPAKAQAELTSIEVSLDSQTARLQYAMKNTGNLHTRPLVRWAIKNAQGEIVGTRGEHEATVLLPQSTLRESVRFAAPLPPGTYQLAVLVDFRDGEPLQSMSRSFDAPPK
jgi:hypothetical protein